MHHFLVTVGVNFRLFLSYFIVDVVLGKIVISLFMVGFESPGPPHIDLCIGKQVVRRTLMMRSHITYCSIHPKPVSHDLLH